MKRASLVIFGIVLLFTGVLLVTGGVSDDSKSSDEALRDAQRQFIGAEGCMPSDVRRRLYRLGDQFDARASYVLKRLPRDVSTESETKALWSDPRYARLAEQMRRLLATYSPGGSGYEKDCYDRAIKRFDRRVARQE